MQRLWQKLQSVVKSEQASSGKQVLFLLMHVKFLAIAKEYGQAVLLTKTDFYCYTNCKKTWKIKEFVFSVWTNSQKKKHETSWRSDKQTLQMNFDESIIYFNRLNLNKLSCPWKDPWGRGLVKMKR